MIFSENRIYLMGILNVTPDSFSDGGKYNTLDNALFRAEKMLKEGADIIDVGGESTKPFSKSVSIENELERVIPVVEKINRNFKCIISIDTYKSRVAEEAIKNGAKIINDISGFCFDDDMEKVALKYNAASIIMHIKGTPKDMQINPFYENVVDEVYNFLKDKSERLKSKGLSEIVIDPGFGFGKSLEDNYKLLRNLSKFKEINCPILAGISRKSMIGKVTNIPPEDRLPGTIALNSIAILNGANIIRCHDIAENFQAIKIVEKYNVP